MNIGYVGLGALGRELARRFLPRHSLGVWDLSPAACAAFEGSGARVAESAAALGRHCDVLLVCLPRSVDVRQLLFGKTGLAAALAPGTLVIDQTSGVPAETAAIACDLAALGIPLVDAAVSANPLTVHAGAATLMVSGAPEIVEEAMPVLRCITETIRRCGARVGDGQAVKLVNNAINAGTRIGTLEIAALGRKAGISLPALAQALNGGDAGNQTTETMLPALARGEASTNFALSLMLKDLNQAVELGLQHGAAMPLSGLTRSLLQFGVNDLGDQARLEDMVGVVGSMAATRIAGTATVEGTAQPGLLLDLQACVAALCRSLTLECVMAGARHGLEWSVMRDVLSASSGWTAAGRTLLPALAGGADEVPVPLTPRLHALRRATVLAMRLGAPMVLSTAVLGLYEAAQAEFGPEATLDRLSELGVRQAGVRRGQAFAVDASAAL
ncbi:NAD-binding protein [Xylophilus sp. GW821-FHT01B05]